MYIPDEIIPADHRAEAAKPGFYFAVTRMPGENFVAPGHYTEIENHSELAAAAVYLAWLNIGDQQGHNQYLQRLEYVDHGVVKRTKRFKLVDMGQMFGNFNWTAASVVNIHTTYQLPAHLAERLTKANLLPTINQLLQIADTIIEECFEDCPNTWGISTAEKSAGVQCAIQARKDINNIIFNGNPGIR